MAEWGCYAVFGLALLYVPVMAAGFAASPPGEPIPDPYQAIMELLIPLMAVALVLAFAGLNICAPTDKKLRGTSALVMVAMMAVITICVHLVVLTVGRDPATSALPGHDALFSWHWPSMVYALDIAAWDFCLGIGLLLAASLLHGWLRRGMVVSGVLCLAGLIGMVMGDMNIRNIGVVGYSVVMPITLLFIGRLFSSLATSDDAPSEAAS